MRAELVVYVSGHGFGHATRTRAWLAALRSRDAVPRILVRTEAPHEKLAPDELHLECQAAPVDPGLLQHNALDIDLPASLAAHLAFVSDWERRVDEESALLRELGARLVVGDVPPLAFAAARRAGVPSVAVSNFSWDWIVAEFREDDPRWTPVERRYREAYRDASLLLRLPLHGDLSAFRERVDVPLLVNRSRLSRGAAREALGIAPGESRPVVRVSFGGLGGPAAAAGSRDDLADFRLVEGDAPPGLSHEDLMQACDVVIGKPGYSTVAEALAHRTRYLYVARERFREAPPLIEGLERHGASREMPRQDFLTGRWRPHLEALLAEPYPSEPLATDGAEAVAEHILAELALDGR